MGAERQIGRFEQFFLLEAAAGLGKAGHHATVVFKDDRRDHHAAGDDLFGEKAGHGGEGGRGDDAVEGALADKPVAAIRLADHDIADGKIIQTCLLYTSPSPRD